MRRIIGFFIEQKSLNHLLFLFLLIAAFFSYENVAKEMFPPASLDSIQISGTYSGASNDTLDKLIVQDCEEILDENPSLSNIQTTINAGKFHINADIDVSANKVLVISEIENALKIIKDNLPLDFVLPTVKALKQFFPLLSISIFSDNSSERVMVKVAEDLSDDIKKLQHIYQSELLGNYKNIIKLEINEEILKAYDIKQELILSELMSLYSIFPIGEFDTEDAKYFISTKTSNVKLSDILQTSIKVDEKILRLKDVLSVHYHYEKDSILSFTNAKPSLLLGIKKTALGDSIELSKNIRAILETYKITYPNINFKVLSDSSFWIKTRLNVVSSNIIIGLILLFTAIWLFISLRIALVVLIGVPVSFAFGIIGLDIFDYSLNTLSMIGVLLALGMLVDEAIVVSENIHRHKEMNKSTHQAILDGVSEVIPVLFASMLTTIVAFLPLTSLSGGLGVFIQIIPLMVIILIISSFIESFVFLPVHYILIDSHKNSSNFISEYRDIFWNKLSYMYQNILTFLFLRKKLWLFLFVFITFAFTVFLMKETRFQLFPEFDAMSINITAKIKENSLKICEKESRKLEKIILHVIDSKNVASMQTTVGMKSDGRSQHDRGDNLFTITLNLHPKIADDYFNREINPIFKLFGHNKDTITRVLTAKEIQAKVEDAFRKNSSYDSLETLAIDIPQTGVVEHDIAIMISHKNTTKVQETLQILQEKMQTLKGVYNIANDMVFNNYNLIVDLNDYGKELGFSQSQLVQMLSDYVQSNKITKVIDTYGDLIELKVVFSTQNTLKSLRNLSLHVRGTKSDVSLNHIATISMLKKVSVLRKEDKIQSYTLGAMLNKKELTSREFYKKINPLIDKLKKSGVSIIIKGEEQKSSQIKSDIKKSTIFSLLLILLILTWIFKSIRLSIFALTPILLSPLGILLGHKLMGVNITMASLLGMVGLIGIIVNDTALMLSFLQNTQNDEAIIYQAQLRLKPILLTSITTILGFATLIFFASGESLLMQPLAISVGFGLIYATLINLIYLPLGYKILQDI